MWALATTRRPPKPRQPTVETRWRLRSRTLVERLARLARSSRCVSHAWLADAVAVQAIATGLASERAPGSGRRMARHVSIRGLSTSRARQARQCWAFGHLPLGALETMPVWRVGAVPARRSSSSTTAARRRLGQGAYTKHVASHAPGQLWRARAMRGSRLAHCCGALWRGRRFSLAAEWLRLPWAPPPLRERATGGGGGGATAIRRP